MKKLLLLMALLTTGACVQQQTQNTNTAPTPGAAGVGDQAFKAIHDKYVVEFLRRNPTVNTYLGGAGLDPSLKDVDGRLRDHSAGALAEEDRWLADSQKAFEGIDASSLTPTRRIDRDVALAQIAFILRQHQTRRYQERAVDTYVGEPFRAIDWQLQGMTQTGEKTYGTPDEWRLVASRVADIPRFLSVAQEQLLAGVKSGNTADQRMLRRDGVQTAEANAKYFAEELPKIAGERLAAGEASDQLLTQVKQASQQASDAYKKFAEFTRQTFFDASAGAPDGIAPKQQFAADRYAFGEEEYNWALKNNLRVDTTAAKLYEESWPIVEDTRKQMIDLARQIGQKRGMTLPEDGMQAVRAVFDELGKDYPKTDAEMVGWYKEAGVRLVDYARKTGVFDVPADYKLDVVETPPPLRASIDGAAYYPAPPFKQSGVGRFYVTTSGKDDPAVLKENNRAALADLSAHEGFPGHDWHYKVMTQFRDRIAGVRWLTPGAVEDSSSMWEDSMAAEGWALYSEALMAEPQTGAPEGFYTPEEHLYQLQGKLYRDLRVRVDTGIHTGRMTYEEAVELFSEVVDFQPGKCADANKSDSKRASCDGAERAIFRYSKWPTQAITYRLGKDQIFALRADASKQLGDKFSPKEFHLLFMRQGTIPAGYFRDELLQEIQKK
ncbi:MAG: hypothetical protein QOJ76_1210 [Acidobacteriota bacterium]|jgi:uncharacterized protein (DUF885 family)|nr:hypothetical protein [Acidobacteriota bacterium]